MSFLDWVGGGDSGDDWDDTAGNEQGNNGEDDGDSSNK